MNFKRKLKIEQMVFNILTFIGFFCIGGSVGIFMVIIESSMEEEMSDVLFFLIAVSVLVVMTISYFINICLHEIGHMIFGLLTGYKFNAIRFGKIMLTKNNGKLRLCRFNMPGTGGQCIMTAPEGNAEKMPVVLFNLGGVIMNLILFIIGMYGFIKTKTAYPILGMLSIVFAIVALIILVTNGLPLSQIGTDGANAVILYRDKNARALFRNQLEIVKYIANNYSYGEMPEELFYFDKSIPMDNPFATAQAINYYNYLSYNKLYQEAKDMAGFILKNAQSINQFHEKILYGEVLFMTMVIDKDMETAKEQFEVHKKELIRLSGLISMQRVLYAYYTLVEPDEKNADKYAKKFENSLKKYPYPKEVASEKEQFDMVEEISLNC